MTDFGVDDVTGLPEPPRPHLWLPTENRKFFRFVIWESDALDARIIDSVSLLQDGSMGHSSLHGGLSPDQLDMAVDWMRRLKASPLMRAVAQREYLH